VDDAALAALCRRAGASLRFLDIRCGTSCASITRAGLDATLQGVDRSALDLRVPSRLALPGAAIGIIGVMRSGAGYRACISVDGRAMSLGVHATADAAARARDTRARALGWPMWCLHFPNENDVAAAPPPQ
jgi:hypothetical protein